MIKGLHFKSTANLKIGRHWVKSLVIRSWRGVQTCKMLEINQFFSLTIQMVYESPQQTSDWLLEILEIESYICFCKQFFIFFKLASAMKFQHIWKASTDQKQIWQQNSEMIKGDNEIILLACLSISKVYIVGGLVQRSLFQLCQL